MINYESVSSTRSASISTDDVFRGSDTSRLLTSDLNTIESNITALQTGKADTNHTHANYLTEDDAVDTFALATHTHTQYASTSHTHSDLENLIEALDTDKADANHTHTNYATTDHTHTGYAESTHTHAQSDVTGLTAKLTEIDNAIAALESASSSEVEPMLIATMHLGKLDNNSGAEVTSTTRICSDPFEIQNGHSYWQVNDK